MILPGIFHAVEKLAMLHNLLSGVVIQDIESGVVDAKKLLKDIRVTLGYDKNDAPVVDHGAVG